MTSPENKVITPTVGRKVWFRPNGSTELQRPIPLKHETGPLAVIGDSQPLDATVVYVWSDRMVNLAVHDHYGNNFIATSVPLLQEGDLLPTSGFYCEWMPYQTAQANKEQNQAGKSTEQACSPTFSQREQLEYALVSGAAAAIAEQPERAKAIADGIKTALQMISHKGPTIEVLVGQEDRFFAAGYAAMQQQMGSLRDDAVDAVRASAPFAPMMADGSPADPEKFGVVVIDARPDLEQQIKDAGSDKAPRVTPAALQAEIVSAHYFTAADGVTGAKFNAEPRETVGIDTSPHQLHLLTFCVLVLRNGFTVVGQSACASPENFNKEIGERIARENAEREIWPLLGFRLRDELAAKQ